MSNTYYQYQDAKVKIAHRLMKREGWKVFGYSASNSDPYTDYFDPAHWGGIATKNGYILVVDGWQEVAEDVYHEVRTDAQKVADAQTADKIKKLERMTQARGASEAEEATAKKKIEELKSKSTTAEGQAVEKILVTPAHKKNPPRCNWHIEKDGIIIDKGTGLLKFSNVPDVSGLGYSYEVGEWQKFNTLTPEEWKKKYIDEQVSRWGEAERARATASAENRYNEEVKSYQLLDQFNNLIARWDNIAGGMVSNGSGTDGFIYEEVTKTEYKTELKPQQTEAGSVADGQCFILTKSFNYGRSKGYVYRIRETYTRDDGTKAYTAVRLGKGYKKECTGSANQANLWYIFKPEDLTKWIDRGAIAWCELVEVKTPYEVKKVVKKVIKNTAPAEDQPTASEEPQQAPKEEPTQEPQPEPAQAVEIKQEEPPKAADEPTKEEPKTEAPKAGASFEDLARGYFANLKKAPKKEPKKEEAPQQEEPEQEPTEQEPQPEPLKAYEIGYNVGSDFFNAEEIDVLINAGYILKGGNKWLECNYFSIAYPSTPGVRLVYNLHNKSIVPGVDSKYCGFIANGKYFDDVRSITEKIKEDVNEEIKKRIPSEADAEKLYNDLQIIDDYDKREIEYAREYTGETDAARLFYEGNKPILHLYSVSDISQVTIIEYIVNPEKAINALISDYLNINSKVIYIYKNYIEYNKIMQEYTRIINDRNSTERRNKKIMDSINEEKTVRVILSNDTEIKVEASAIKRIGYAGSVSSWYIKTHDTAPKDERGRVKDITPQDIKQILHGQKILYKAS